MSMTIPPDRFTALTNAELAQWLGDMHRAYEAASKMAREHITADIMAAMPEVIRRLEASEHFFVPPRMKLGKQE